jgi:hypothetical protein
MVVFPLTKQHGVYNIVDLIEGVIDDGVCGFPLLTGRQAPIQKWHILIQSGVCTPSETACNCPASVSVSKSHRPCSEPKPSRSERTQTNFYREGLIHEGLQV